MNFDYPDFPTNTSSGGATGINNLIKNKQGLILFDYPDYRTNTSSGGAAGISKKYN
jgi:hypothetical protein